MSDPENEANRAQLRERLVFRLGGFIQGIGLSVEEARQIVERAIADDPAAAPADIEAKARAWMLHLSTSSGSPASDPSRS